MMYNITFTYVKQDDSSEIQFNYIVNANSYEEAVALVQTEASKRVEKRGGRIISIA